MHDRIPASVQEEVTIEDCLQPTVEITSSRDCSPHALFSIEGESFCFEKVEFPEEKALCLTPLQDVNNSTPNLETKDNVLVINHNLDNEGGTSLFVDIFNPAGDYSITLSKFLCYVAMTPLEVFIFVTEGIPLKFEPVLDTPQVRYLLILLALQKMNNYR